MRVSSAGYGLAAIVFIGFVSVTIVFQGQLASLLAAATSSIDNMPVALFFAPRGGDALTVGETADVDLDIEASVPINALGVTISFPKDQLEVVGISKQRSFLDLWTEDTVIKEDTGELHFSGGTTKKGGLVGSSTVLTFTVLAKKAGTATLAIEEEQVFAGDGKGSPLQADARSLTFSISPAAAPNTNQVSQSARANSEAGAPKASAPDPDLNGDGSVGLADLSILFSKMTGR